MLKYGYACLSPHESAEDQHTQLVKLEDAEIDRAVIDKVALKSRVRPELRTLVGNTYQVDNWRLKYPAPDRIIGRLNKDDVLVVTDLSRLGFNAAAFGRVIDEVLDVGASVQILDDRITIKSTRDLAYRVLKAATDAEWRVQGDSTRGGHIEGRKRGRRKGRFPILNPGQEKEVFKLIDGGMSQMDVMRHMRRKYPDLDRKERGFSQPTISRMLKRRREEQGQK
jgi:DNA invertase Pin-like site-specific DNA recombinase